MILNVEMTEETNFFIQISLLGLTNVFNLHLARNLNSFICDSDFFLKTQCTFAIIRKPLRRQVCLEAFYLATGYGVYRMLYSLWDRVVSALILLYREDVGHLGYDF